MKKIIAIMGIRIKELRIQKGLSQEALADLVGLHRTYIGSVERGEKTITISSAKKIADGLEISLSELFKGL